MNKRDVLIEGLFDKIGQAASKILKKGSLSLKNRYQTNKYSDYEKFLSPPGEEYKDKKKSNKDTHPLKGLPGTKYGPDDYEFGGGVAIGFEPTDSKVTAMTGSGQIPHAPAQDTQLFDIENFMHNRGTPSDKKVPDLAKDDRSIAIKLSKKAVEDEEKRKKEYAATSDLNLKKGKHQLRSKHWKENPSNDMDEIENELQAFKYSEQPTGQFKTVRQESKKKNSSVVSKNCPDFTCPQIKDPAAKGRSLLIDREKIPEELKESLDIILK